MKSDKDHNYKDKSAIKMKIVKLTLALVVALFVCSILPTNNLQAESTSENEFNNLTTYFYLNPQPDRIPSALEYFLKSQLFRANIKNNGHVIEMLVYFFGRVANINPILLREYEKRYDSQDKSGKLFLISIFAIASDEQNKQFLRDKLTNENEDEMKKLLEKIIDTPPFANKRILKGVKNYNDLDFQWMEFFVTGEKEPIVNLIDVLSWEDRLKNKLLTWMSDKHTNKEIRNLNTLLREAGINVNLEKNNLNSGGDMDCMFSAYLQSSGMSNQRSKGGVQIRKILGLSDDDMFYMTTKGADMWALQSNAQQHPKVLEYCKQEFERKNDKSKIELVIILELASKGSVELVPTEGGDMSTLKLREGNN